MIPCQSWMEGMAPLRVAEISNSPCLLEEEFGCVSSAMMACWHGLLATSLDQVVWLTLSVVSPQQP